MRIKLLFLALLLLLPAACSPGNPGEQSGALTDPFSETSAPPVTAEPTQTLPSRASAVTFSSTPPSTGPTTPILTAPPAEQETTAPAGLTSPLGEADARALFAQWRPDCDALEIAETKDVFFIFFRGKNGVSEECRRALDCLDRHTGRFAEHEYPGLKNSEIGRMYGTKLPVYRLTTGYELTGPDSISVYEHEGYYGVPHKSFPSRTKAAYADGKLTFAERTEGNVYFALNDTYFHEGMEHDSLKIPIYLTSFSQTVTGAYGGLVLVFEPQNNAYLSQGYLNFLPRIDFAYDGQAHTLTLRMLNVNIHDKFAEYNLEVSGLRGISNISIKRDRGDAVVTLALTEDTGLYAVSPVAHIPTDGALYGAAALQISFAGSVDDLPKNAGPAGDINFICSAY